MKNKRKLGMENGFNRYMVECEYCCLQCVGMVYQVLIDTWWNVNNLFIINYAIQGLF